MATHKKTKAESQRIPAPAKARFEDFADKSVRSVQASIHIGSVLLHLAPPELINHAVEVVAKEDGQQMAS